MFCKTLDVTKSHTDNRIKRRKALSCKILGKMYFIRIEDP
jgi:hypothetical protein